MLGVRPDQLGARDRKIQVTGFPQKNPPICDVASKSQPALGRPILGNTSYSPPTVPLDPETGQGKPFNTYVTATQIAEVEVDTETGQVDILRTVAAHDCGTSINPMLVEGQLQGGIAMGTALALSEEIIFSEGVQLNPNMANYMVPTIMEVPPIEVVIVKSCDPSRPFGAKGVGEPTSVPTAPAILNAIFDAVGIRIDSLPATPEKILHALREKSLRKK